MTYTKKLFHNRSYHHFLEKWHLFYLAALTLMAQSYFITDIHAEEGNQTDAKLIEDYVKSKGNAIISFDSNNIKQYWIDKSVVSRNNNIEVMLEPGKKGGFESIPLKIQLANVNETLDCKVEIITENSDLSFVVTDSKTKTISSSVPEDNFVEYHVLSSLFHLEDIQNDSFNLLFSSKSPDILAIKKIILSFSGNKNSSYVASPGIVTFSEEDWIAASNAEMKTSDDHSMLIKGEFNYKKKILVSNNTFKFNVKVKNTNAVNNRIWIGVKTYAKDRTPLRKHFYAFKSDDKIIKVLSKNENNNSIIVDSCPLWEKGCFLAINAKENFSDVPNYNLVSGRISEVKEHENGTAEIFLDKPINNEVKEGTHLRIHSSSSSYVNYVISGIVKPGEEKEFEVSIKKDDLFFEYSPKAFSKGIYYVIPIIVSSDDILIQKYSLSF